MHDSNEKLTPAQAALILNKKESTLARERSRGTGCAYLKQNGKVLYLRSDVKAYAAKSTTRHDPSEAK
ncbi:helix-turn-helix domain-containing protein [Deefgea salmonis]|uniref:Helix-turn-helix domain-containing protein n=1 Tax=Deefgea salmonis TaxID=2875502 RepID=A0ABS8BMB2_9NEIS|nr:helix-turn-helix domain-containing protein [Deefgea salmonis]MCB5196864.1 helix-turn-helix domain-containing protein [Deefgea salmonis]